MGSSSVLADEFAGDKAWDVFVLAVQSENVDEVEVQHLCHELDDNQIAKVLASTMGGQASTWLVAPCKALGNASPIDVFRRDKFGPRTLKALLMRMPR
jgi:hypothetical protein